MTFLRIATIFAAALCAFAAGVDGKWTGKIARGDQQIETTFEFKSDGGKLTGTVTDSRGAMNIADGKVEGDKVSFSVQTQRGKRTFTGMLSGDEIKFKREGGQNPSEFVAKRAK